MGKNKYDECYCDDKHLINNLMKGFIQSLKENDLGVLLNIFKVLKFYDDLKPTLKKALDDIHYKEKWYLDKED